MCNSQVLPRTAMTGLQWRWPKACQAEARLWNRMENEADRNTADATFWTEKGKMFLKSNKDTLWYKSIYTFKNHIAISLICISIHGWKRLDRSTQNIKTGYGRITVFFSFSQYPISIFYYKRKWLLKGTDMIVKGKERQGCHKYITDFWSIYREKKQCHKLKGKFGTALSSNLDSVNQIRNASKFWERE